MPKKFPPPKPADGPVDVANPHPAGGSSDDPDAGEVFLTRDEFERLKAGEPEPPTGLHPEIVEAVRAGGHGELCERLMRKGIGMGVTADLLLLVWSEAERLQPIAAAEPELARRLADERDKQWCFFLNPGLCAAMNAHGEAVVAVEQLAWIHSMFPSLFGLKPRMLGGAPKIFGRPSNAVYKWFNDNHVDPMTFDSWRKLAQVAEPPKKIRLRVAGGVRPRF